MTRGAFLFWSISLEVKASGYVSGGKSAPNKLQYANSTPPSLSHKVSFSTEYGDSRYGKIQGLWKMVIGSRARSTVGAMSRRLARPLKLT